MMSHNVKMTCQMEVIQNYKWLLSSTRKQHNPPKRPWLHEEEEKASYNKMAQLQPRKRTRETFQITDNVIHAMEGRR